MTPFDLLRRYFAATWIGQVQSRGSEVSSKLVESVSRARYGAVRDFAEVFSIPTLQDAKVRLRQAWQDIDDEDFRRL